MTTLTAILILCASSAVIVFLLMMVYLQGQSIEKKIDLIKIHINTIYTLYKEDGASNLAGFQAIHDKLEMLAKANKKKVNYKKNYKK